MRDLLKRLIMSYVSAQTVLAVAGLRGGFKRNSDKHFHMQPESGVMYISGAGPYFR